MRLSHRIRRIAAAAGIVPDSGVGRRVSEQERAEAFERSVEAFRADLLALISDRPSLVEEVQLGQDTDTLKAWSRQRGLPGNSEFSRAQDAALESMTDDQLRTVIVRLDAPGVTVP